MLCPSARHGGRSAPPGSMPSAARRLAGAGRRGIASERSRPHMAIAMLNLGEIVATSLEVSATRSRKQKTAHLARLLSRLEPSEVRPAVGFVCGELRQGKLGIGYRTLQQLRHLPAASGPNVSVLELDEIFQKLSGLSGKGSAKERERLLGSLFARLTDAERDFVARLMVGELRQGALEALVVEALGQATNISTGALRRAMLFAGDVTEVAVR